MSYSNYYPESGLFHVSIPLLMGTRMDVLLLGHDRHSLETIWEDIERKLRMIEKMLNRFDAESETAKVNQTASFSPVRLSDTLWDILLDCRRYYEETDGFFDITKSDFRNIIFMETTHSVLFSKNDVMLDFGGYGKGYALKCMQIHLDKAGIKQALINFGSSSVLALGAHPYGDSWPVGIEDPSNGMSLLNLYLRDLSLSVSGNTPARISHILNPKTAELITGERMVAIVADDPVDAEALTTAWIASGMEEAPYWMSKFNLKNTYRIK